MTYRFALGRHAHADLAAGAVLYSAPGQPAFPVRLTSEIFQRCEAHLTRLGREGPYGVYDPCCGSGYLLTTLGLLHRPAVARIVASDADADSISIAQRNLSLLAPNGMDTRIDQLDELHRQFGKASHELALASARRLRDSLAPDREPPITRTFVADALRGAELRAHIEPGTIDMVITDVPYGLQTTWHDAPGTSGRPSPEWQLLDALRMIVVPHTIVAITTSKRQKLAHDAFRRVEQLQIGKRRTQLFMPAE